MLTFNLYCDEFRYTERKVSINPAFVMSVREGERRPMDSGYQKVAYIRLSDGTEHCVYDFCRSVAREIADAQIGEEPR